MTDTKRKHTVNPITASELMEIGKKDIRKMKEFFDQGRPIELDDKSAAIIKKDLGALPKAVLEKIQSFAKEIGTDLDKPGFADVSLMTGYISGLIDATDSTAFGAFQSEFPPPSSTSSQSSTASLALGLIYVLAVILIVLLILLGLKWALTGGVSTPKWWNVIIHGPNDPNGPIGPDS